MKKEYLSEGRIRQKMATRKHILEQTQVLLSSGKAFGIEDVVEHSGLSRATVYRYFPNIDALVQEAGLDIKTASPEMLLKRTSKYDLQTQIIKIQQYFNDLAFDNEEAFRKYLGTVLGQSSPEVKRGARRVKTLRLAMDNYKGKLDKDTVDKLINTATVLMGIEALIVTRDVCGLSKQKSKKTLQWALDKILSDVLKTELKS